MASSFEEQSEACLREWSAFVDRLHEAARGTESAARYQMLDLVGALRIRIASALARIHRMRLARGARREILRKQIRDAIAELHRIAAEKRAECTWRLGPESGKVLYELIDSVSILLPNCGRIQNGC
ncbi:MAG TPA: hypothetical protein VN661_06660 [Candidatus Acidoferrales bacterium]|nr:hypothetical protein [Candidatus Acidoferrales bacterium]